MSILEINSLKKWKISIDKNEIISMLRKEHYEIYQIGKSDILFKIECSDLIYLQRILIYGIRLKILDKKIKLNLVLKKNMIFFCIFIGLLLCGLINNENLNLKRIFIFVLLFSSMHFLILYSAKSIFIRELKRIKLI